MQVTFLHNNFEFTKKIITLHDLEPLENKKSYSNLNLTKKDMDYNWKNKTIIIAEDDEMNFILLKKMLEQTNASIKRAYNGQDIINCVEDGNEIDLIIMDLKMPEIRGDEATMLLRENNCNIPIIIQSAISSADDIERFEEIGCNKFLRKPINKKELIENVNELLSEK